MKTKKEIAMYNEGVIDGYLTLRDRLRELLRRRENVAFNWQADLTSILAESALDIHKLENFKWNKGASNE